MEYYLIQFTKGLYCKAYQEVSGGSVVRYTDLDGNTLELPEVTESHVIEKSNPEWDK